MNVKPVNGYKKPLYALGVTATVMAVSLTGCADFMSGRRPPAERPTETVMLEGETTVVNPPDVHTNTEYDVNPYLVTSRKYHLESKVTTDTDQLTRYAVSKLERITKSGDLCCEGRYQEYDFLIVRTDKFSEWLSSNDQYTDSISYDNNYYLEYKRNAAESDLLLVCHDPSDRFMIITGCADNKVIWEFFKYGNGNASGSGESTEATEFTGNKEFPVNYETFAHDEFYDRIMEAQYALRWAKDNHVVVFEDSNCVSGKDMWEAFIYSYRMGKPAMLLMADYHPADKKNKTDESLDFYYINMEFDKDGSADFYLATRRSDHKKIDASASLKYLKHFTGTDDVYIITNDKDASAEAVGKMKLGPDRRESFFNHFVLRFKAAASS